ncbi:hypothetical protein BDP27DRAFT_1424501 [Rhodocollybia butyracea]|uniref:Uncharacterized protein n=1 Tax=Rhodocollybia butyracea TaxID=206335 RepID=A0A9P5PM43_9AGAR|nr:hypothetical protein BDP27DRAFT_1424501 [Rhodocollybia butyracea]
MAPTQAYYLPADSASAIDTSHQVSVEHLNALGWRISSVRGGPDEIKQAGLKLAKELGFPVTQDGCVVPFNADLEKNAATMTPEMLAYLKKTAEVQNNDTLAHGGIIAVTGGSPYADVEGEYNSQSIWIRIHFAPGMLVCAPTGAKYRLALDKQNRGTTGIAFFKETISNHGWLVNKDIDNHPTRRAYLNEVLRT